MWLYVQFFFFLFTFLWTVTILRVTHSDDFDARLNFFRLTQNSEQGGGEVLEDDGESGAFHTFVLIARSGTGWSKRCPGRRQ